MDYSSKKHSGQIEIIPPLKMKVSTIVPSSGSPKKIDRTYIISVSFIAGFLIGIPITYSFLFLPIYVDSSFRNNIPERTLSSLINDGKGYVGNDTPDLSARRPLVAGRGQQFAGIKTMIVAGGNLTSEATSSLLRHPAGPSKSLQTITEKSGPGSPRNKISKHSTVKDLPMFSSLLVKPIRKIEPTIDLFFNNRRRKNSLEKASKVYPVDDVVDGVFWTPLSERFVPKGFDDYDTKLWKRFLNSTEVLKVEEGCGRMQNRLVTLAEGGKSCCRYRHNNDQIQGEIFSFYLGRLLGIRNLAPSALAVVDGRTKRWSSAASQIALAQWNYERPVVLTQFVEDLQPAFIPRHFRLTETRRLHPITEDVFNLTAKDISMLVQWSDLIVFDYLTGNLDRVVNNMYNERWNPEMMNQPTHNLFQTPDGLLLFLDNESGLLHGYRLLEKYDHFHKSLLDSLCIFKKETIEAVDRLHEGNLEMLLQTSFGERDPGMVKNFI
ncbi:extracellular serine/threonine protein kinase four-jointed-like [Parasteatoda tepidariorum]|uniref:extracellular serine/threonine protein kinase four-jointed-like n=1 Tax=Parasteatoda tepidariorum TaxID=114398 RepID=UPI001C728CDA|nr:extracellular serine/threonine protein kinase four-jointed-like [Parasteatoda tepidariorum]